MKVLIIAREDAMEAYKGNKIFDLPVETVYTYDEPGHKCEGYFRSANTIKPYDGSQVDLVLYSKRLNVDEKLVETMTSLKDANVPFIEMPTTDIGADTGEQVLYLVKSMFEYYPTTVANISRSAASITEVHKVVEEEVSAENLYSLAALLSTGGYRTMPTVIIGYELKEGTFKNGRNKMYMSLRSLNLETANDPKRAKITVCTVLETMTLPEAMIKLPKEKLPQVHNFSENHLREMEKLDKKYEADKAKQSAGISTNFFQKD